jgi:hypothetical protein
LTARSPTNSRVLVSRFPLRELRAHLREMEHVCGYEGCMKPSKYAPLLICSGYRAVRYCDVGCQKAAWKGHKAACRAGAAELSHTQLVPAGTVRAVSEDALLADVTKLRVLAAQGNADAEYVLGLRYATGKGVPEDDKAAAEWYLKAARQGHAHAQYNIGCLYDKGKGVAQDHKAAFACTSRPLIKAWPQRSATLDSTLTRAREPRRTTSRLSRGTRRLRAKGTRPRCSIWP